MKVCTHVIGPDLHQYVHKSRENISSPDTSKTSVESVKTWQILDIKVMEIHFAIEITEIIYDH
jgi:hypothetical protein